ncbi:Glutamate--tRNA ligase [Candidatus Gugararchaeum adminiculabundum]|nr:Glutamate--tRNA ligase [Candidatus Gugararchaeum adminiculabundum]
MSELNEIVRKHVVKNALDYGKANAGAVVGRVIGELPEAKNDMKETMKIISKAVAEVNKLSRVELEGEAANYTYAEKKVEEKKIVLPNAERGKVVTRFPPEPSGYPHIGHAKAALLDYEAAKEYDGKFLIRFDDTNPEKEKAEYVEAILNGLKWLGVKWDGEVEYTSDFMPQIYSYARKLIAKGKAYVCFCAADKVKTNRQEGIGCECRDRSAEENLNEWKKMLAGEFSEGKAIVRYRGDMSAENTVMRDPTMLRIIKAKHYRQGTKYSVWPSYDFSVPIVDSITGITHAMRTKEYELRDYLYYELIRELELRPVIIVEFSRLQLKGFPVSKRLITPLVEKGKVHGWDDPRLPTLMGLKRRGILPEAARKFALSSGIGKSESTAEIEQLLVENKRLVEPTAQRRYFVKNPVKLTIKNKPGRSEVMIRNHPTNKELGERKVKISDVFYISGDDARELERGSEFRLKELYNVKIVDELTPEFFGEYEGEKIVPGKKLHWVSDKGKVKCRVIVPGELFDGDTFREESLKIDSGYCEESCEKLKIGDVIQFERYGFCRFDAKEGDTLVFIYTNP